MLISRNEKVKIIAILSIISIIILLIFQGEFYPYAYLLVALLGGVGIIVSKNRMEPVYVLWRKSDCLCGFVRP